MATKLLTHPRFWPLFWTQFAGAFNDNLYKNALVLGVAYGDRGAFGLSADAVVALAGAIFIAPYFLVSATAGQLADRHEKSRLVRATKLAEIGAMGIGALGFVIGSPEIQIAVLFAMGTQSAFFGPVKYGILPQLLPREDLVGGNALVELATYLAILLGTLGGGLLVGITWEGRPVGAWAVAASVLALAIVGWRLSRRIPECPPESPHVKVRWDPVVPTWQIIRLTRANPVIWRAVLAISWFWGFGGVFLALFPLWTKGVLHGAASLATLFLAVFSVGIGIGSMVCERLSRRRLELGIVPIGSIGMSLFTLDLWLVGEPWSAPTDGSLVGVTTFLTHPVGWRILADLFGVAGFGGLFVVPLYTLLQDRATPSERSRIIAGNNIVNAAWIVLATGGLVGLQAMGWDPTAIFAVLAAANALVALYIYTVVPEFMLRFCAWILSNLMYRVQVDGEDRIPSDRPCVIVCNHVSFVDWLILLGAIRVPVRFVMDQSFAKLPVIGWLSRQAGVIPIASAKIDPAAKTRAFETIHDALKDGWIVGIFPEGQITRTGTFNPFRPGVEQIVARDPVPVVPLALNGLWGSWFSRKDGGALRKRPRRLWSRVYVTVGEPVPPERVTAPTLEAQVRALWEAGGPP